MKPFGYKGEKGTCLWCGDKLRHRYETEWADTGKVAPVQSECFSCEHTEFNKVRENSDTYPFECKRCGCEMPKRSVKKVKSRKRVSKYPGYYLGQGHFCTLSCGFKFGESFAKMGRRLMNTEGQQS